MKRFIKRILGIEKLETRIFQLETDLWCKEQEAKAWKQKFVRATDVIKLGMPVLTTQTALDDKQLFAVYLDAVWAQCSVAVPLMELTDLSEAEEYIIEGFKIKARKWLDSEIEKRVHKCLEVLA